MGGRGTGGHNSKGKLVTGGPDPVREHEGAAEPNAGSGQPRCCLTRPKWAVLASGPTQAGLVPVVQNVMALVRVENAFNINYSALDGEGRNSPFTKAR